MMLLQSFLPAALLLIFAIDFVAANPGDVLACVPCPNNDCTGKTYADRCTEGICMNGKCQAPYKRDVQPNEQEVDTRDLALRNVSGLEKRLTRISAGCVVWVKGLSDAGLECDYCNALDQKDVKCTLSRP